jgi:hypothetical protein
MKFFILTLRSFRGYRTGDGLTHSCPMKLLRPTVLSLLVTCTAAFGAEKAPDLKAEGWVTLGQADFVPVNGEEGTWTWGSDGILHGSGMPIGVMRTVKQYKNFEMSLSWSHLKDAGNSGVFVWVPGAALDALKGPGLPNSGIEVQILDHGYTAAYEKSSGKKADWFTCHGDVFAVGKSTMKPFPPLSPDGSRSFPSKQVSKGVGEWNHYLIRAVDGTIRLWVNGEQVSGGEKCDPAEGFLCLEAEGSPIDFKEIKIREIKAP